MLSGVLTITQTEGARGLYKGLLPAMSQIAPQIGLQFGFYALLKDVWQKFVDKHNGETSGT